MAFLAQWIFPLYRRTKIIFSAALAPSILLITIALVGAIYVGMYDDWFQAAVSVIFFFLTFVFVGLVGAIMGSELTSLVRWLSRSRG
jgi:hypothetical protein